MNKYFIYLLCFSFSLLTSCAEDYDRFVADPPIGDVQFFYEDLTNDFTSISIDNRLDQKVVIEGELLVNIPSTIFQDSNGTQVLDVEMRAYVLDYAGDYIKNELSISEASQPIETLRLTFFTANGSSHTQDDQLIIDGEAEILIQIPVNKDISNASVQEIHFETLQGLNRVDLQRSSWVYNTGEDLVEFDGYEFTVSTSSWYQLSSPLNDPTQISIQVTLPPFYDDVNTDVYAISSSMVAKNSDFDNDFNINIDLEEGETEITLISISNQDENIYHFAQKQVASKSMITEVLIPRSVTKSEILDILDAL